MDFTNPPIKQLIELALAEDLGDGDHSSLAAISKETMGESKLLFKEDGILAGIELASVILKTIDPTAEFQALSADGDAIKKGTVIATAKGRVHSLLAAERLLLNFMQRLSGIATATSQAVALIGDTTTKILDTRKTTPGLRILEKWAVKMGGGVNHRIGLYDMIMLKDNHIDSAGGITQAVLRTQAYLKSTGKKLAIEVETRNLSEVQEALEVGGVDRIMLDNFTTELCAEAVRLIRNRCETEASGGITMTNLREYALTGVDFISLGFLTHSSKSLDISMKTHAVNSL
jgi:nicotinate-nucleotide pyrophosphorylase (carboxylating)